MEKSIKPPPYPQDYGSSLECWYTITAPENSRIRFWVDDFGTEQYHNSRFYLWVSKKTSDVIGENNLVCYCRLSQNAVS